MQQSYLRSLLVILSLLSAYPALALPWAMPGADCESLLADAIRGGAERVPTEEPDRYFIKSAASPDPFSALFECPKGTVESQIVMIGFSSQDQARFAFLRLRDELERILGRPEYDSTNPQDRRELSERAPDLAAEPIDELLGDWIKWNGWSLSLEKIEWDLGRWKVGIVTRPPDRRITIP